MTTRRFTDSDYNLLLSIQWQTLMQSAEDQHLLNEGYYESRPHHNANDPVFIEEMQIKIYRASRQPLVTFDNDATSCYDRILPNMASIACRKFGSDKNMAIVWAKTLEEAQYKLSTMLGASEKLYSHCICIAFTLLDKWQRYNLRTCVRSELAKSSLVSVMCIVPLF